MPILVFSEWLDVAYEAPLVWCHQENGAYSQRDKNKATFQTQRLRLIIKYSLNVKGVFRLILQTLEFGSSVWIFSEACDILYIVGPA